VTSTSPAIEATGLAKTYGSKTALRDLTIAVGRGEIFGFLGPNGAGKTTAVKLLLGLATPSSGSANVLGEPLGSRAARRKIGYLPELFRYQEWLSARDAATFHAELLGIGRASRAAAVGAALERVGLGERRNDRVGTFSKGMQQRLGLAIALLGEPDLVFLDEPTSALDPVGRHDVRDIIESLAARGAAVFLNSHLLTEVERVCARVAVVDRGTVVAQGSIADLLGANTAVRLRLADVGPAAHAILATFGTPVVEGEWTVLNGTGEADVPRLVAELVGANVRVYGVETTRATLEERFLQLLRPPVDDAALRDRSA
jgi:ABC-2 type transport system ATP-binding protein